MQDDYNAPIGDRRIQIFDPVSGPDLAEADRIVVRIEFNVRTRSIDVSVAKTRNDGSEI